MCGLILSMYAVSGQFGRIISLMQFVDDNVHMKPLCFA